MSPPVTCKEATSSSADSSICSHEDDDLNITSFKDISIASSEENKSIVKKNETHHTTFNESSFEAHVLKVASETTIVDSQLFDEHLPLD